MKNRKLTYAIPVLLLLTFVLGACQLAPAANAQNTITPAESAGSLRTISITGTGEVILVPDMAYINVGIHTEADDVTSAVSANNQQAASITAAIVKMGVEAKDIQTSNFNVYSMNRYDNMSNIIGTSFAVDNTLYIIVRDLPKLSEMLDAALSAGANQIYGITFDIADRSGAIAAEWSVFVPTDATATDQCSVGNSIQWSPASNVSPAGFGMTQQASVLMDRDLPFGRKAS